MGLDFLEMPADSSFWEMVISFPIRIVAILVLNIVLIPVWIGLVLAELGYTVGIQGTLYAGVKLVNAISEMPE